MIAPRGARNQPHLGGCAVLVVEDDYFLAGEICDGLRRCGGIPVGPASTVAQAMGLMHEQVGRGGALGCAVLDIKLRGEPSFKVARELEARGLPFVYVTGFDAPLVPEALRGAAHLAKPVDVDRLLRLVGQLCHPPPPARPQG